MSGNIESRYRFTDQPESGKKLGRSLLQFTTNPFTVLVLTHAIEGSHRLPVFSGGVLSIPYGASASLKAINPNFCATPILIEYMRKQPDIDSLISVRIGGTITLNKDIRHPEGVLRMEGGGVCSLSPYEDSIIRVEGLVIANRTNTF